MKISIIHPTRGRKEKACSTAVHWLRYADNPYDIEYLISVDVNDTDKWYDELRLIPGFQYRTIKGIPILKNNNRSAIDAINNAAKVATGDLIMVVSDDFTCPNGWDTRLLKALEGKSDFLVKTIDSLQPTLITLPIMDRTYYNRFGYVYHPDYLHMFCDQEMTAVGHMLGKVINLNIPFEHLHYSAGKSEFDAVYAKNNATWAQGESLFNERLKTNFGIYNPVVPYSSIKWR